jgi:replicative DNA helicase
MKLPRLPFPREFALRAKTLYNACLSAETPLEARILALLAMESSPEDRFRKYELHIFRILDRDYYDQSDLDDIRNAAEMTMTRLREMHENGGRNLMIHIGFCETTMTYTFGLSPDLFPE